MNMMNLAARYGHANADADGWTPLHWAADEGYVDVVELLITAGADVNARDNDGWTPLHVAAYKGHAAVAEVLLAVGADPNKHNAGGWTPYHFALVRGSGVLIDMMIAAGADTTSVCEMSTGDPRKFKARFIRKATDGTRDLSVGCRLFTTADAARKHWGEDYSGDRAIGDLYLAALNCWAKWRQ
jgi:ankyrin repeat protein